MGRGSRSSSSSDDRSDLYFLALHLPLYGRRRHARRAHAATPPKRFASWFRRASLGPQIRPWELRSEEHTSELQSLMRISYAVFCLQKKKHTPSDTQNV